MSMTEKKEDNINSLCKKYFTPELCDEPVTETKETLFNKLLLQLKKYGYKVGKNYSALVQDDIEEILDERIFKFYKKCKENQKDNYTAFYKILLEEKFTKANIKAGIKKEKEVSIDNLNNDNNSFEEIIADDRQENKHPELETVIAQLDQLDIYFQKWCDGTLKKGGHKKDETTKKFLSELLTFEMRDAFLKYEKIIKEEYNKTYSFMNKQILNMSIRLSKAYIAELNGLSDTRGSHIFGDFQKAIQEQE